MKNNRWKIVTTANMYNPEQGEQVRLAKKRIPKCHAKQSLKPSARYCSMIIAETIDFKGAPAN